MSDENLNTPTEPQNDTPNEGASTPEPTPVETQARALGWIPKEEYEGDEALWLDAGEFVRRQPLFEKIERQNRELKEVKRTMALFAKHHEKVRETEYQRALATLQEQKVAAFEEGDARAIVNIDNEIRAVEKAKEQFVSEQAAKANEPDPDAIHPEFAAWTNRNPWYTSDNAMKAYADAIGRDLAHSGKAPTEVLKEVEKRVRENFPTKFKNTNREKPGAVEGTSPRGSTKGTGYTPTDFERRVAEKFVKQGLYKSTDEYYKELNSLNGKS